MQTQTNIQTHIPIFSIHVTPYTPPGRTIARWDTWMKPPGNKKSLCYDVRTPAVSSATRNALGLTGFGSFGPQSCPDMIELYVAERSSGPPRKKRGLCLRHSPIHLNQNVSLLGLRCKMFRPTFYGPILSASEIYYKIVRF